MQNNKVCYLLSFINIFLFWLLFNAVNLIKTNKFFFITKFITLYKNSIINCFLFWFKVTEDFITSSGKYLTQFWWCISLSSQYAIYFPSKNNYLQVVSKINEKAKQFFLSLTRVIKYITLITINKHYILINIKLIINFFRSKYKYVLIFIHKWKLK